MHVQQTQCTDNRRESPKPSSEMIKRYLDYIHCAMSRGRNEQDNSTVHFAHRKQDTSHPDETIYKTKGNCNNSEIRVSWVVGETEPHFFHIESLHPTHPGAYMYFTSTRTHRTHTQAKRQNEQSVMARELAVAHHNLL